MNRLFNPLCAAPIFLGMICGFTLAADAPPGTQEWFRGQNPPMTPPAPSTGDFGQTNVPPGNRAAQAAAGSDFPTDQMHDWVVANAQYAYWHATFHRAEKELEDTVRMAQFTFEQSKGNIREAVATAEARPTTLTSPNADTHSRIGCKGPQISRRPRASRQDRRQDRRPPRQARRAASRHHGRAGLA